MNRCSDKMLWFVRAANLLMTPDSLKWFHQNRLALLRVVRQVAGRLRSLSIRSVITTTIPVSNKSVYTVLWKEELNWTLTIQSILSLVYP